MRAPAFRSLAVISVFLSPTEHSACVMTESATKRRKQRGPRPAAPQVVSRGTGCSSLDRDPVPAPCSSCEALDGFLTSLSLVPFL